MSDYIGVRKIGESDASFEKHLMKSLSDLSKGQGKFRDLSKVKPRTRTHALPYSLDTSQVKDRRGEMDHNKRLFRYWLAYGMNRGFSPRNDARLERPGPAFGMNLAPDGYPQQSVPAGTSPRSYVPRLSKNAMAGDGSLERPAPRHSHNHARGASGSAPRSHHAGSVPQKHDALMPMPKDKPMKRVPAKSKGPTRAELLSARLRSQVHTKP